MIILLFYNIQVGKGNAEIALLLVEYDKDLKVFFLIAYFLGHICHGLFPIEVLFFERMLVIRNTILE